MSFISSTEFVYNYTFSLFAVYKGISLLFNISLTLNNNEFF